MSSGPTSSPVEAHAVRSPGPLSRAGLLEADPAAPANIRMAISAVTEPVTQLIHPGVGILRNLEKIDICYELYYVLGAIYATIGK